tara:strand:- start:4058 stop:5620 length:1563 start_codon:yes stop_codon:yes gene_type:complete
LKKQHKISASQLKTAFDPSTGCKRKWAFNKIEGITTPSTASQALGTQMHTVGENYLRNGILPDLKKKPDRIFASGMHLLPDPKSITGVEVGFDLVFNEKVTFHGFIDFMGPNFAGDHKSTSNFRYMLSPKKLLTDPQGVIYGMKVVDEFGLGLTDKLSLIWVYYLTRGKPEARKLEVETTRAQLERTYFPLSEQATQLVELRDTVTSALDVEPNYKACGAYGGCPFASKCDKDKSRSVYSGLEQKQKKEIEMSSLLERLKARSEAAKAKSTPAKAKSQKEIPSVVSINPPKIVEAVMEEKVESQIETEEKTLLVEPPKTRGRPKGSKNKPKVNPKVAKALDALEAGEAKPIRKKAKVKPAPKASQLESQNREAPDERVTIDITDTIFANEATVDITNTVFANEATAVCDDTVTVSQDGIELVQPTSGYTLYINCVPSKGGVDITQRLSEIANECAENNGVGHYRYIRFGEAPARFSESVTESLKGKPLSGKIIVVDTNLMVRDCIEVLIQSATEVVRAIK